MGHKKQRRRTRALLRPVLRGLQAWRETPSGIPNHAGPRCRGLCQRRANERSTLRGHVTRMPALADEEASSARRPGVLLCGPRTRDGDPAAKGHGRPRETARRERAGVCRRLDSRRTERLGGAPVRVETGSGPAANADPRLCPAPQVRRAAAICATSIGSTPRQRALEAAERGLDSRPRRRLSCQGSSFFTPRAPRLS